MREMREMRERHAGVAAGRGEKEETKRYGSVVRSVVSDKLLRDVVTTAAAAGCSTAHTLSEDGGPSWSGC